jgi:hypothetical protein
LKTHPELERPPDIGENPHPLALARFILWKFLQMPAGGLYAKWNAGSGKATWFYLRDRDFMFREPCCDLILYEEHDRSRFRSLIFRFGTLGDDGLCGSFEFERAGQAPRKYSVHSSFFPGSGTGLWIAITSRDEPDDAVNEEKQAS